MQCLPSLDARQSRPLPLFGLTGRRLVTALLAAPGAKQLDLITTTVADDPVLALWIAIRFETGCSQPLRSVAEAANWLATCWPEQLQWPGEPSRDPESPGSAEQDPVWQQRLVESVLAARLARQLMESADGESSSGPLEAESAYWMALLQQGFSWIADCFEQEDLPSWIADRQRLPQSESLKRCLQVANELTCQVLQASSGSETPLSELDEESPQTLSVQALEGHLEYARSRLNLDTSDFSDAADVLDRLARLQQLEHQFARTLEQEKLASLKELAYGASHEINNPLANISSRAQTLLRDETDPERQRMLATINSQAFRAHEMISDMMLFAKPPQMDRKSVDVIPLIRRVVDELADDAQRQGTTLLCPDLQTPIIISIDEVQVTEALKALCRNALESVGVGGQVDILVESIVPLQLAGEQGGSEIVTDQFKAAEPTMSAPRSGVMISVKDNGPGISDEVRAHLFDPFFSGREAGRGLGFGLSKCWRIVTEHGGQVEVHSSKTEGTIFTLRFPQVCDERSLGEPSTPRAEAG